MKRFFVFMLALAGLGVVMSGCVANMFRTTKVKDSYIQKNYIDKVKVDKKKVVGDRNIKFYVGKVLDKRKDKAIVIKRTAYIIRTGDTELVNPELTTRNITKKALYNTGWGVVDNKSESDFVVKTELKDFATHWGLILPRNIVKSNICFYKGDKVIIEKYINAEKDFLIPDLTAKFEYVVGKIASIYYTALINYFSSPEFVKAVKKAYANENDNLTETNN